MAFWMHSDPVVESRLWQERRLQEIRVQQWTDEIDGKATQRSAATFECATAETVTLPFVGEVHVRWQTHP